MRRRPIVSASAAALVAVGSILALDAGRDVGDAGTTGDGAELAGYRIDYDVEVFLPSGTESGRRQVQVLRPFAGLDVSFASGSRRPTSGAISDGVRLLTVQGPAAFDAGAGAPGVPPGDHRLAAVLDDLVRLHLVERRDADEVAGRACEVYRTGAPLGDAVRPPSGEEHVDWCIDDGGLLLRERWYLDGELLRSTTATRVELRRPAETAFAPPAGITLEPNPAGTSTREALDVGDRPDVGDLPYWIAADPAGGFALEARWRVVETSSVTGIPQVQGIAYVDVYRDGVDAVLVEHREAAVAGEVGEGLETVDAGRLGPAQVRLSERGAELVAEAGPWVVSVHGPRSVAALADFAAGLRPVSAP